MSFRYAAGINKPGYNGLLAPDAPTAVTASVGSNNTAIVSFTAPSGTVTSYSAISTPGDIVGSAATSPVTVSGFTQGQAYTFVANATNSYGTSVNSAASNSITPNPFSYLYIWGSNTYGQLGLGNSGSGTNRSSPTQLGSGANWSVVAGGSYSSYGIKSDGTLWSWGSNNRGALGLGNTTYYSSPKQVGALTNWLSIAGGSYAFAIAVKTDGTLWSWGSNGLGQLGLGNTTYFSSPKQVGSLTNWLKVIAGNYYAMAIKTDGTLWAWGSGSNGNLAQGNTTAYSSPKQVGLLTNWSQVDAGYNHVVAVKTNGTYWAWGRNINGQLGIGNTTAYSSPKQVGALTTWSQSSTAYTASFGLKTDGTLWSWGDGGNGQTGLGNEITYSSPKQVGNLTTWTNLSVSGANKFYCFGAIQTGKLFTWGYNNVGQLGLGNTTNYSSPKQVGSDTTWLTFSMVGSTDVYAIGTRSS